jgi:hypothetical protein
MPLSRGGDHERPYLSHWLNRRDHVYSFVPRASLTEKAAMAEQIVRSDLEDRAFIDWTPVFAGALVTASLSSVLLSFGSAIGLAVA